MAKTATKTSHVKLKPADPFDLIRWLARSQSDPRKAIAELIQNSLDAGATHVQVIRKTHRKSPVLVIEDDGNGVIPELDREQALRYLASHVGHSRKRGLTPEQRAQQVVAGQYGVGLLGFWAIGREFELRTRVNNSELFALCLEENSPRAKIEAIPMSVDAPATFTHVVIRNLHSTALRVLGGRKLADYLAAELRGQLLQRKVELVIHDRLSRSPSNKHIAVVPRRFVGERLAVPRLLPIPGFPSARVELFLSQEDRAAIQVACAGTLIADDIGELSMLGLNRPPWIGQSLTGLIDFASFQVPPGTRRGIVPNDAAHRFASALNQFAEVVNEELARREHEQSATKDRQVIRDLRRALRGFQRRLPQYEFPTTPSDAGHTNSDESGDASQGHNSVATGRVYTEPRIDNEELPPPVLASVSLTPSRLKLAPGKEHKIRAVPKDPAGNVLKDGVTFAWSISPAIASVVGSGRRPTIVCSPLASPGDVATIHLDAVANKCTAHAVAELTVTVPKSEDDMEGTLGIIDPELVHVAQAPWRSRMVADKWQINAAHEDYIELRGDSKARLRYLLALLAKEMVCKSYGKSGDAQLLEHMVEILAHAERNLRRRSNSEGLSRAKE